MIRDFTSTIGMVGCALVLIVVCVFAAGGLYLLYLNTFGVATMNTQRQITTHSQQYVQTQQQVLVNLYADWVAAPDETHKASSRLQICAQAAMLDPMELPVQVAPFIAQNCH